MDNGLLRYIRTGTLGIGLLLTACATPSTTIGVIDVEQAYQRSPLAMASAVRLNAEFSETRNAIKARGRELANLHRQLESGGDSMSPDGRALLEARIASETAALTELQSQYRADLQAAQQRESDEMAGHLTALAAEIAKREGLTLLVEHDAVLYASASGASRRDITDIVIRELLERMNPTQLPTSEDLAASEP